MTGIGGAAGLGGLAGDGGFAGLGGLPGVGGKGGEAGTGLSNGDPGIDGSDGLPGNNGLDGASGLAGEEGQLGYGIYSDGEVYMGLGNDTIDALIGGFGGTGFYDLGTGFNTVKGFGSGTFVAGTVEHDDLVLPGSPSDYTITQFGSSPLDFTVKLAGDPSSPVMFLFGFDKVSYVDAPIGVWS